jgi:hypothetical protein
MSLYNAMCGNNPLFGVFARILETQGRLAQIPRFRDMYSRVKDGKPQIVIYSRTGGGNRGDYLVQNGELTHHALYIEDFDDDFDSTFAHFVFKVPDKFEEPFLKLHNIWCQFHKGQTPKQKFDRAMRDMKSPDPNDTANNPTEEMVEQLQEAINGLAPLVPRELSSIEAEILPSCGTFTYIPVE